MTEEHEKKILNILRKKDKAGNIIARESEKVEFKKNFNFLNIAEYSRDMAAFANNVGGYILFGIKDSPRKLVGINHNKFNEVSQEKITSFLLEYFNPEIKWEIGLVQYDKIYIGFIYTHEAESKPIICKKNKGNIIKNGEIYYRYRAQTRNIQYAELKKIIDQIREVEKQNWVRVINEIAKIGPENAVINKKSKIEMRPSSSLKALQVRVEEKDIKKLYPWDYKRLTAVLRKRYKDFKQNQRYHELRKKLKPKKEFCFTRRLDPDNPKSPQKDFYSKEIIKEFDKFYTLK